MNRLDFKVNDFGPWERRKAFYLINLAEDMGFFLDDCAVGLNMTSGNVYIWSNAEDLALYLPISCELNRSYVWVAWIGDNGDERVIKMGDCYTLEDLHKLIEDNPEGEE